MRKLSSGSLSTLLGHRPFRLQFGASATSMVGSAITPVAMVVGVLEVTGSAASLGLVLAAYSVPQVVFLLVGGVWADRMPRQRIMMLADALRVVTQVTFGVLLLSGNAPLWAMICLQAVCGMASALFLPASMGLVSDTAPPGLRQEANALLSLTRNITGTIGPILAGAMVVLTGAGWAMIIDGMTFLGSFVFLAMLSIPERERTNEDEPSFLREALDGFREVRRLSWVWTTIVYCMVFNLTFAAFQVLGPSIVVPRDNGAVQWGLVVGALGFGQVLGNALALVWRPERPLFAGRLIMLLGAPALFLLGQQSTVVALMIGSLVLGVAISFPDTLWDAALQEHVRPEALARVSSFDYLGSFLLRPIGLAVAGLAAAQFGLRSTLVFAGILMTVATLVSLLDRGVITLRRTPGVEVEVEEHGSVTAT